MKKIKIAICSVASLILSGLATSCSDYLDKEPDTELNVDMVFENREKIYSWLSYVYNVIHTCDHWQLNDESDGFEIMADDLLASRRYQQWDWKWVMARISGAWSIDHPWTNKDPWIDMPKCIRHGYLFNERVHALPKDGISTEEVELMKNEVKFLCAYGWWFLAENYGGIPFSPNLCDITASLDEMLLSQAKFDDVVDYCDKEMLEAANALPSTYSDPSKYGRITKIMALTIRARMLLFAASKIVNGNTEYADYKNSEGENIFNQTYDASKWKRATDAIKLLIDEAEAAGYELYKEVGPDGESIDPYMSTYNVQILTWSEGNHEILFPVTRDGGPGTLSRGAAVRDENGGNGLGIYQGLIDAFFTESGLPITEDPEYTEEGFSTEINDRSDITTWSFGDGKEGHITAEGIYNMWVKREPRFYNCVSYHGGWLNVSHTPIGGRPYDFTFDGKDNKQSSSPHDAPQNGYLPRKGICQTDDYKEGKGRMRIGFIARLATAYLDYAEAINETENNSAARQKAIEYVNRIRERAGIRQYTFGATDENFIHVDDTQDAVRTAVRRERRVELCCEGNRLYDIRRWMIAEEIPEMNGYTWGMNVLGKTTEEFCQRAIAPEQKTRVWKRQYYWFPISLSELENNPKLVEAPGWK